MEYVESRLYRVEPALSHSSGCHSHCPPSPPSLLPPPSTAAGCRSPHLQLTPPAAAAVDCRQLQLSPPSSAVAAIDCRRCRQLSPSVAATAVNCRRRRPLPPRVYCHRRCRRRLCLSSRWRQELIAISSSSGTANETTRITISTFGGLAIPPHTYARQMSVV